MERLRKFIKNLIRIANLKANTIIFKLKPEIYYNLVFIFCSHSEFMCFVQFSQYTAIISLNSIFLKAHVMVMLFSVRYELSF
jgi:hypothetical protein